MKYRILTNGKNYIVQTKVLGFFWETRKYCIGVAGGMPEFVPIRYKTEKKALISAKSDYGNKAERVRKYKVV